LLERIIEAESHHSGSPDGCAAFDARTWSVPTEVLLPAVGPRIKETHYLSGAWIGGGDLFPLYSVAERARQSQVLKDSNSSFGSGKNVIQVKGVSRTGLGGATVLTAPAGPGDDLASQVP